MSDRYKLIIYFNGTPKSIFQRDCKRFLIKHDFDAMMDNDGELVVDTPGEMMCIREFRNGTPTSDEWNRLQKRYDKGEK